MPFPGEADQEALDVRRGHAQFILVRQVKPALRMRAVVSIDNDLLPLPDDEATAHALFEAAAEREAMPSDRQALDALIEKYTVHRERGQ